MTLTASNWCNSRLATSHLMRSSNSTKSLSARASSISALRIKRSISACVKRAATKRLRTDLSMQKNAKHKWPLMKAFALLYLNKNLEQANEVLTRDSKSTQGHVEGFLRNQCMPLMLLLLKAVWYIESRMSAENEKMLLAVLWEKTYIKNDIHLARQSTWYLEGSENHDLNLSPHAWSRRAFLWTNPNTKTGSILITALAAVLFMGIPAI